MTNMLFSEIDKYREDENKNDSLVIRKAVDFLEAENNCLSNQDVEISSLPCYT